MLSLSFVYELLLAILTTRCPAPCLPQKLNAEMEDYWKSKEEAKEEAEGEEAMAAEGGEGEEEAAAAEGGEDAE